METSTLTSTIFNNLCFHCQFSIYSQRVNYIKIVVKTQIEQTCTDRALYALNHFTRERESLDKIKYWHDFTAKWFGQIFIILIKILFGVHLKITVAFDPQHVKWSSSCNALIVNVCSLCECYDPQDPNRFKPSIQIGMLGNI